MELTSWQEWVIAQSRRVAENPERFIPASYDEDDYRGRNDFLVGFLRQQLRVLLSVTDELAGTGTEGGGH